MQLKTIALWVPKTLLALVFLATGSFKLSSSPMMVTEFGELGFGIWFMYFTGAVEILCAILLLIPRTAFYGAVGVVCVCIGAFFAQYLVFHKDIIHTIVLGVIGAGTAYAARPGARET